MHIHEEYIRRCLQLSQNGKGAVAPNPLVGCVIVHDGVIIGEGWHKKYGGAHAEVNAISATRTNKLPPGSTAYVNLEPCAHHGKTPPCCDLLIDHGIENVVVGVIDPYAEVQGRGIDRLVKAGVAVTVGVLEEACRANDPSFYHAQESKLPYVTLKWAQSADGFVAPHDQVPGSSVRLTAPETDVLTHSWRAEHQAILIGSRTALQDDPQLNVRHVNGQDPIRLLLDRNGIVPDTRKLFDGSVETWVFGKSASPHVKQIEASETPINQILQTAYAAGIHSIYVEGGSELLSHFLNADRWNEVRVIQTPHKLKAGVPAPAFKGLPSLTKGSGPDMISIYHHG